MEMGLWARQGDGDGPVGHRRGWRWACEPEEGMEMGLQARGEVGDGPAGQRRGPVLSFLPASSPLAGL